MTSLFRQISAVVAMTIGGLPSRFWGSMTTIFSIALVVAVIGPLGALLIWSALPAFRTWSATAQS